MNLERYRDWICRLDGQNIANTVKNDVNALCLAAVYRLHQWNRNWVTVYENRGSDHRQLAATIRYICGFHEAGST